MAFIMEKRNDPNFGHYISGLIGIQLAGECLEPFTINILQELHGKLDQLLSNFPECTNQCSEQIGDLNRWCNTCREWKNELIKYHRRPKQIDWRRMHSWLWPTDPSKIAEVFCGKNSLNPNLKDVSNIFIVWNNCREFDEDLVKKSHNLRNYRNDLCHNKGTISGGERDDILQSVKDLISEKYIKDTLKNFESISDKLRQLEGDDIWFPVNLELAIESLKNFQNSKNELTETQNKKHKKHNKKHKEHSERLKNIQCQIDELKKNSKTDRREWYWSGITTTSKIVCAIVVVCACLVYGLAQYDDRQTLDLEVEDLKYGCLLETHPKSALKANFSMREYLSLHVERFHGRKWLYKEVEKRILVTNQANHGTLMIAEMGYGKTAFFANLICAGQDEAGIKLREHLVAYHMCQFESKLTRNVGLFIHRFVSMLSVKLLDYANFLRNDGTCLENYRDRGECEADMFGCFDHCILFPIRHERLKNHSLMIIAIDAVDECQDAMTRSNRIFDLLVDRLYQLPLWLRFLVTSRHFSGLSYLKTYFDVLSLSQTDKRNIKDIVNFLEANNKTQRHKNEINARVWNFQFHILGSGQNNAEGEIALNLETSLEQYYTRNFRRIFGNKYETGKQILAVICASSDPLDITTLSEIAVTSNKDLTHKILKQELDKIYHLTNIIKGKLHLIHFSFMQWLLKEDCPYHVDLQQGHHAIALYYTDPLILEKDSFDMIDLLLHISKSSKRSDLIARYKNLNTSALLTMESRVYPPLYHRLILATNDGEVVKLAYHHFKDIDATDNLLQATALYKAAAIGNLNLFNALVEFGADINFRIDFPRMINVDNAMELLTHLQWDYGILDIASMNGHKHIVKHILNDRKYDFERKNGAHLLPIHLACKFGSVEIVRLLHQNFPWMLDDTCLYYGAIGGFDDVVNYCFEKGIYDTCIPCNASMYWIKPDQVRLQGDLHEYSTNVVLYDDWRLINCQTALHGAVIRNKTNIVHLMVNKEKNDIGCYDRSGRTPFMFAIIQGYEEIGSVMMNNSRFKPIESCRSQIQLKNTSLLNEYELLSLENNACPEGFSLLDISHQYDRSWFSDRLTPLVELISDSRDEHGCHSLHYAACRGNTAALKRSVAFLDITRLACTNGSLLIHSAAICGSVEALKFLKQYFNLDVADKTGRTPKMYAVMRKLRELSAIDSEAVSQNTVIVLQELSMQYGDLYVNDDYQRSLLHYSIESGQFGVIGDLFDRFPNGTKQALQIYDINGLNSFAFGVTRMEKSSSFFLNMSDVLKNTCSEKVKWKIAMSPVEYTLFQLLLRHSSGAINLKFNHKRILIESVKKNRLQLFAAILRCVNPLITPAEEHHIFDHLTKNDVSGTMRLLYIIHRQTSAYESIKMKDGVVHFQTKHFASYNFHKCQHKSTFSIIHYLALYFNDIHQILQIILKSEKLSHRLAVSLYFDRVTVEIFNECYDSDGFNILERAIQGGSKSLVKLLLDKGFTFKRQICELLMMSITSYKYKFRSNYTWDIEPTPNEVILKVISMKKSVYTVLWNMGLYGERLISQTVEPMVYYDQMVQFLLKRFRYDIPQKCICSLDTINLSLIHYLAIQNFELSTKVIADIFGKYALECKTDDHFTPLYLANIFESSNVTKYLEWKKVKLQLPLWDAEQFFIFLVHTKYYFDKITYRECFPTVSNGGFSVAKFRKAMLMVRCVRKLGRHLKNGRLLLLANRIKAGGIVLNHHRFLKDFKFPIPISNDYFIYFGEITAENFILHLKKNVSFQEIQEIDLQIQEHFSLRQPRKKVALMKQACAIINSTTIATVEKNIKSRHSNKCERGDNRLYLESFQFNTKYMSLATICKSILRDMLNCDKCSFFSPKKWFKLVNQIKSIFVNENLKAVSVPQFTHFYNERLFKIASIDFANIPTIYMSKFDNIKYTSAYIEKFHYNYANNDAVSKASKYYKGVRASQTAKLLVSKSTKKIP